MLEASLSLLRLLLPALAIVDREVDRLPVNMMICWRLPLFAALLHSLWLTDSSPHVSFVMEYVRDAT